MDKESSILPVFKLAMEDVRTANLKDFLGFETLAFLVTIFLRKLTERDF